MPERWDGPTPTDPDEFAALEERAFINPFNSAATAITETFVVPASCKWSLKHIPYGNLTSSSALAIYQGTDDTGTLLTCTTTTGSLSANQVRVQQRTGFLEFYSGLAGETVYIEYDARVSNIDAAYIAQLHAAVMRVTTGEAGESFTTGETVVAGPGYVSGSLLYQADPTTAAKAGHVWISADTSSGNSASTLTMGTVTPRRTPPDGPVYCGHGGDITWDGDTEVSAMLATDTDYKHCIGWYYNGQLHLNTLQDVRRIFD